MDRDQAVSDSAADLGMLATLDAAAYLGITRMGVYAAMRDGRLVADEVSPRGTQRRTYRFHLATLAAYRERMARRHAPTPGVMLPHLRAWRRDLGLSVAELAARTFCTSAYIRMLENGQRGASRRFIPLLALALDMDPATLQHEAPRSTAAAHPRGAARTSRRSGTAA